MVFKNTFSELALEIFIPPNTVIKNSKAFGDHLNGFKNLIDDREWR
jgi:hypothetical protein